MSIFKGVCTALITPFYSDGSINYNSFSKLLDFQIENGVNALLVCGTTGEPATMSDDEKLSLVSFTVKKVAGRVPIIVGIGGNNTAGVATFVKQVQELGISALLAVTPYYNKSTQKGLVSHYSAIAEATALPIIVYNVPSRTGVNILPETLKKLADIPNIVGIKEASGNMAQAVEMLSLCGDSIDMYSGNDDITIPILSVGGKGVISVLSNIMPAEVVSMNNLYFEGDVHTAAKLQKRLMPIIKALFSEVNPIPVKTAASIMGICSDRLRLPLTPMEESSREALVKVMNEYML